MACRMSPFPAAPLALPHDSQSFDIIEVLDVEFDVFPERTRRPSTEIMQIEKDTDLRLPVARPLKPPTRQQQWISRVDHGLPKNFRTLSATNTILSPDLHDDSTHYTVQTAVQDLDGRIHAATPGRNPHQPEEAWRADGPRRTAPKSYIWTAPGGYHNWFHFRHIFLRCLRLPRFQRIAVPETHLVIKVSDCRENGAQIAHSPTTNVPPIRTEIISQLTQRM